ncbi:MAG: DUF3817 domain-containing protein [Verrucomicrobiae bacterium]|nr:DUF3817 domain-containing protein [Verrucomicrobiae bacterium]MCP5534124.1 DUF3817 domain-containing protein [Akkermansiaceae bacterium]MCP5545183.1 DUF3817 domain-containing protein [Akkermansiaceae bacterium]MCP5546898.1 DUF3817 domain-containing protein [Akkermansiaceae bacterium]
MNPPFLRFLRIVSFCEGVSFVLLLFVAMPLKYIWHQPEAVSHTGMAHGVLFIALYALILACWSRGVLPTRTAALTAVAALLPGGPFVMDRRLKALDSADA